MPYIIETRPQCPNCRAGDGEGECLCADAITRRAVATLDDAHAYVTDLYWRAGLDMPTSLRDLRLPDGTVIEVERKSGYAILQMIHPAERRPKQRAWTDADGDYLAAVIDAYNAA